MTRKTRIPPRQGGEIVPFPDGREVIINASQVAEMAERIERRVNEAMTKLELRSEKSFEHHDRRLVDLEKWQWSMKPYIAAVAAILALLGGMMSTVIVDEIKTIKAQVVQAGGRR